MSSNDNALEVRNFITRQEFETFSTSVFERIEANEHLSDLRTKQIISSINENMAEINSSVSKLADNVSYNFTLINERINNTNDRIAATNVRIDHLEKFFTEKIEHVTDTLTVAINSVNQRIDDIHTEHNKSLAKWGISVAVIIGLFQAAVSVILHFWK